ncbi:MAG: serine protease [Paludibacter sp.]|nr:serine protease [Paludibacter sp.]
MFKKIIILVFVLLVQLDLFSQKNLRDFVVVVRPVYRESTVDFLKNLSKYASDNGYPKAADYLDAFAEGKGFGSGFLVKGSDGLVYVLTNRHVILQAEKANIEFFNSDGSKVSYNDCEIVAIDPDFDLALLAFPKDVNIDRSLNLRIDPVEDGQEVFSAGFPGLNGKPSWQLGKGIVSNSTFEMSNLDEDVKTFAIQHTAQIDRGSSGSPLLIADTTQTSGYSVVGLNTWKVFDRESVNLSIPNTTITKFISEALSQEDKPGNETLEKISRQFVGDLMHGYKKVLKYVAYDYVSKLSAENFIQYLNLASDDAKEDIYNVFQSGQNPVEAVRIAIADAIVRSFEKQKNTLSFSSIAGLASSDAPATVFYMYNNKPITTTWQIEQKSWKLLNLSNLKFIDADERIGFVKHFDFGYTLNLEAFFPSSDIESVGYGFELLYGENYYTGLGVSKYNHHAYSTEYNYDTSSYEITKDGYINYYNIRLLLGYRYPFQIKRYYIIPFIQAYGGMNTGIVSSMTGGFKYGVNLAYKFKNKKYIMLSLSFNPRKVNDSWGDLNDNEYDYIYEPDAKIKGLNVGLSYAY